MKTYVSDTVLCLGLQWRGLQVAVEKGVGVRIGPQFYGRPTLVRAYGHYDGQSQKCRIETWSERVLLLPQVDVYAHAATWPEAFDAFVAKWREFEGQCLTQDDVTP